MRRLLDAVLTATLTAGLAGAATLSDGLVRELQTDPNASQRIIVFFEDAPGSHAAIQSTRGDRARGIEVLKQNAALAQADFMNEAGHGFAGVEIQQNWLSNAAIMDATPDQIAAIQKRDDVKRIEVSETITLEPFQEVPVGKLATGDDDVSTWGLKAVKALEAQATYAVDGTGVVVGILDTGYDANHPSLAGKLLAWKDTVSDKNEPYDDNGHGTHCAGTIGGDPLGTMAIGVAPGVKFVAGKIFSGGGSAQTDWILNGMQWVVDPDGQPNSGDEPALVSNSWGGGPGRTVFLEATKAWLELGIAPIFAAGNSGPGAGTVGTPGGFLESIAVGATTVETTMAGFSSRGPATWDGVEHIKPDVSAPGKDVTSAKAGGGSWTISGTSMATPHVAGMSALLYQANPDLTVDELREVLEGTAIDHGPAGKDNDWGSGLISAMDALAIVISGGKISGTVKDAEGNAIPYAKVTIVEKDVDLRIGADGSFRATLPEGQYTLASKAFGFVEQSSDSFDVAAGQELEVHIVMDKAESGSVVANLTGGGAAVEGSITVLDTPLAAFDTDAAGTVSFDLPAGTYTAMARAYGFEMGNTEPFTVVAGETVQVSLDLASLPPVLLVDDDDGKNYETYFAAALEGSEFKTVDYSSVPAGFTGLELAQYEMIVWSTGNDYQGSLTEADQAALAEYLDMGGRLLISGQDVGYEIKNTTFYAERMKASFKKDAAGTKQVTAGDLSFSIEGGDGANNQRYPDVIEALDGAEAYYNYADGTVAGTRVAAGDSRLVYMAFGLEGIDTAENRKAAMDDAIAYLQPSADEFAARLEKVAARRAADADEARELVQLTTALEGLVATRIQSIQEGDASVTSRTARRAAGFRQLFN